MCYSTTVTLAIFPPLHTTGNPNPLYYLLTSVSYCVFRCLESHGLLELCSNFKPMETSVPKAALLYNALTTGRKTISNDQVQWFQQVMERCSTQERISSLQSPQQAPVPSTPQASTSLPRDAISASSTSEAPQAQPLVQQNSSSSTAVSIPQVTPVRTSQTPRQHKTNALSESIPRISDLHSYGGAQSLVQGAMNFLHGTADDPRSFEVRKKADFNSGQLVNGAARQALHRIRGERQFYRTKY